MSRVVVSESVTIDGVFEDPGGAESGGWAFQFDRGEVEGDLLVAGSCQLVRALCEHHVVDEYRLMVHLAGSQTAGETLILTFVPRGVG